MARPVFMTIVLLVVGVISLFAGTKGKIAGRIIDKNTGEPLMGANIVLTARWVGDEEVELAQMMGAASDADGRFFIINIPPGSYTVKATYLGYNQQVQTQVKVIVDRTTRIDFGMESTAIAGERVVVTAYRDDKIEIDITATKQTYTVSEVEEAVAGINDIEDILELQADVIDNHFRGGRENESTYLMGGSPVVNPIDQTKAFNPMVLGLEQVEVLTSGFSAEYGNAQSGIVNMVPKEGGDRWRTTFEMSSNMPYYKNWVGDQGANFYDPSALPWHALLDDTEDWLAIDPATGQSVLAYFENLLAEGATSADSLYAAQLRLKQYQQFYQDIGREYKNRLDYRIDVSTGGPVSENMSFFLAARQENINQALPLAQPDINRQIMTNLSYRPTDKDKLLLSYTYSLATRQNTSASLNQYAFLRRTQRTYFQKDNVYDIGLKWNHVFSPSTFMEWNVKMLSMWTKERLPYLEPDDYDHKNDNRFSGAISFPNSSGFTQVSTGPRGDSKSKTFHVDGSFSSQINNNNLIKGGLQFFLYEMDVYREMNIGNAPQDQFEEYDVQPYEGALYVQDKMEWEGMIANIGLRLDYYNFNTDYFADIFSPVRNPNYDPTLPYSERGSYYDEELALKEKTELFVRLQPRIGISFPISEGSVVHLNYGTFTQRPPFTRIFNHRIRSSGEIIFLGNPRMEPENTTSYDVGLVQALPLGFRLDVSAYYKDVKNLIETTYYTDSNQWQYQTFQNRDYANIKGFHVSLEKYTGWMNAIIRYNYQSASGKASTPFEAPVYHYEDVRGEELSEFPDPEDIYLDYDRTHRLVANLTFNTGKTFGPEMFGMKPLSNMIISGIYKYYSGRPYTWDDLGLGLKMNKRAPGFGDLRIRIQKQFNVGGTLLAVYLEGFNVLNKREYAYRVFSNEDVKSRWENETDRDQVMIQDEWAPYVYREDLYLIANQPRHFRLGMKMTF